MYRNRRRQKAILLGIMCELLARPALLYCSIAASYTEAEAFLQPQSTQHPQNAPWLLLMGFLTTVEYATTTILLQHTRQNTKLEAPAYFIACIYTHTLKPFPSHTAKKACVLRASKIEYKKASPQNINSVRPLRRRSRQPKKQESL